MSVLPTFCTADVPASVINHLIYTSSTHHHDATNIFSLIRHPDQPVEELDIRGTTPPVADFETGFKGKSIEDIQLFLEDLFSKKFRRGFLEKNWFAVLDEKSLERGTLVICHGKEKGFYLDYVLGQQDEDEDENVSEIDLSSHIPGEYWITHDDDDDGDADEGYIWWQWRIPFAYAWHLFIDIAYCDMEVLDLYSRPEYRGKDGVVDAERCHGIVDGKIKDPRGLV